MGAKTGLNAKIFYKVGGVAAQGEWEELTIVRDNTLNLEKGEADVTTRGSGGWRATLGALKDATVEFEVVEDPEDAGYLALQNAFFDDAVIGLSIMDGELESGTGLQADFAILKFNRNEPLEEGITVSVTAKPTYSATAPVWLENGVAS